MSRYRILALACTLALVATTAAAQRRGGHAGSAGSTHISMGSGGSGRAHIGTSQSSGYSYFGYGGASIAPLYYNNLYYGGFGDYGFSFAPVYTQILQPYPYSGHGGPVVIISSPPAPQVEPTVIYVPSYMRSDPGPSLGEIARAVRAQKERARTY